MRRKFPICDLDGTLIDSDAALAAAFRSLGVAPEDITYGHVLADECQRLGLSVESYLAAYDPTLATPFPGVESLVASLERWAVCSNKHPHSGRLELDRLSWTPEIALFADSFNGPKQLAPVLRALNVSADEVVFVGDTDHDRQCAHDAGVTFLLAGWNLRATPHPNDVVLTHPSEVLEFLG